MKFGNLTYKEIRQAAESGHLAIVPTGCTEQQGPHLPVDFDTWLAEVVCLAASERAKARHGVESLVLPAVPFGPTPEHRGFGTGFIDLPQPTHEAVVQSVLESLAEQGFADIVVWRGCGQHDLAGVVQHFNGRHTGRARAHLPDWPYKQIWERLHQEQVESGHADGFATSLALHLRPESVRRELIPPPELASVNWDDPELDLSSYSSTGVVGNASVASAERGEILWDRIVEQAALRLAEIASGRAR